VNFVKKLQLGTGRFRGKLPFKFFVCGRVGQNSDKCPHKYNHDKGKEKYSLKKLLNSKFSWKKKR